MIGWIGYICRETGESCRGCYGNGRIAAIEGFVTTNEPGLIRIPNPGKKCGGNSCDVGTFDGLCWDFEERIILPSSSRMKN